MLRSRLREEGRKNDNERDSGNEHEVKRIKLNNGNEAEFEYVAQKPVDVMPDEDCMKAETGRLS